MLTSSKLPNNSRRQKSNFVNADGGLNCIFAPCTLPPCVMEGRYRFPRERGGRLLLLLGAAGGGIIGALGYAGTLLVGSITKY